MKMLVPGIKRYENRMARPAAPYVPPKWAWQDGWICGYLGWGGRESGIRKCK